MNSVAPDASRARAGKHLLVWDAPNMDMTLSTLLGGRPTPETRPSFLAVGRWLVARAGNDGAEAAVFTNIVPDLAARVLPWVTAIRSAGFAVFAKPKVQPTDDIDDDLADHVRESVARGDIAEVIVASHDAAAFIHLLEEVAATGVKATMLGFMEFAAAAVRIPEIEFVDLESVPGVFAKPLPRTNLFDLPREGAWFEPLHPLPVVKVRARDARSIAVEAIRSFADETDGGVLLSNVGVRLASQYPEVDLKALGYLRLIDAVRDLAADAGIQLDNTENGHPVIRRRSR